MATLADTEVEANGCVRCSLAQGRTTVVFGTGDVHSPLMFVGEAPGHDEDLAGQPFVGRSGKLLDRLMAEELGIDRSACYITNVVKCRPPANRDPRPDEIAACSPYLHAQLELIAPRVVVTLGSFATRALLETTDTISSLRGKVYPFRGRLLVPTFHPAAALRGGGGVLASMRADLIRAKRALATTVEDLPSHTRQILHSCERNDPASRDPASGDPASRDPASRDPASRDPASRDPASRDPAR